MSGTRSCFPRGERGGGAVRVPAVRGASAQDHEKIRFNACTQCVYRLYEEHPRRFLLAAARDARGQLVISTDEGMAPGQVRPPPAPGHGHAPLSVTLPPQQADTRMASPSSGLLPRPAARRGRRAPSPPRTRAAGYGRGEGVGLPAPPGCRRGASRPGLARVAWMLRGIRVVWMLRGSFRVTHTPSPAPARARRAAGAHSTAGGRRAWRTQEHRRRVLLSRAATRAAPAGMPIFRAHAGC